MSPQALGRHGLLDVSACRRLWQDFAERGRRWHGAIWNVLMFQAWWLRMGATPGAADGFAPRPRTSDMALGAERGSLLRLPA